MEWKTYSNKWMRLGNTYFSLAHVSSYVINDDECTVYMDDGSTYLIMGKEEVDEFMRCLFGR